jgi:hypothetical protein
MSTEDLCPHGYPSPDCHGCHGATRAKHKHDDSPEWVGKYSGRSDLSVRHEEIMRGDDLRERIAELEAKLQRREDEIERLKRHAENDQALIKGYTGELSAQASTITRLRSLGPRLRFHSHSPDRVLEIAEEIEQVAMGRPSAHPTPPHLQVTRSQRGFARLPKTEDWIPTGYANPYMSSSAEPSVYLETASYDRPEIPQSPAPREGERARIILHLPASRSRELGEQLIVLSDMACKELGHL